MQKVVVTGMGLISPVGLNLEESWENLKAGKSGIRRIDLFDPTAHLTKIAAQLPEGLEELSKRYITKRIARQMTRVTRMNLICNIMAVEDSGIDFNNFDRLRCGVIIGATSTCYSLSDQLQESGVNSFKIIKKMNNAFPAWVTLRYELEGSNYTVCTACSSAAYAIGLSYDLISLEKADVMLAGGADSSICPEDIEGFNELMALSTRNELPEKASCPFDKKRDGFVMGEGTGMLLLESEESAKKRSARIYAELAGYAFTGEAYNILSPQKDGIGMAKTMELALKHSQVNTDEVDYINAHGTSTPLNDLYETQAVKKIFGDRVYSIPISSTKSMLGHSLAASGGIEAVVTCLSIYNKIITPTINYEDPDPQCNLNYVPNQSREGEIRSALSNSFAFGGQNATLVFRKYK